MNKSYKSLTKIGFVIIVLLGIYFFPDYGVHILVAVLAAMLIEFANRYSRDYVFLRWLQIAKEKFYNYQAKKKLKRIFEREQYNEYSKKIIDNALVKVKSSHESERQIGFEQLSQFGDEYAFEKLLDILKSDELDKTHEKRIVETVCKIFSNMNINK